MEKSRKNRQVLKMEKNKAIVNGGIVKATTYAKKNDKGEVVISKKNKYMLEIVKKAASLKAVGYNFVIDTKFDDKLDILSNYTECKNSQYDATRYYLKKEDLVNLLHCVNLFLVDRQLFIRENKNKQLIVKVFSYDCRLKQLFIRDKNSTCVKTIEVEDLETHEISTIEQSTKSGMFFYTDDEKSGFYKKSQEFINGLIEQFNLIDSVIPGFLDSLKTFEEKKRDKVENA